MTVKDIKEELQEMMRIAQQNTPVIEDSPWRKGFHAGYTKAITDTLRYITQKEYLEELKKSKHEETT